MQLVIIKRRTTPTAPPPAAPALAETRGRVGANGTVYWGDNWQPAASTPGLTEQEMKALRDKHKSPNINTERAIAVKNCMRDGMSCAEIIATFRSRQGYGERSIKADHAALSPIVKGNK